MKVSRNYDAPGAGEGAKYRISFELSEVELRNNNYWPEFQDMWANSRLAADYLKFLAEFAGIAVRPKPQGKTQPPPEDPLEAFRRAKQRASAGPQPRQSFGGFGFDQFDFSTNFGFDPGFDSTPPARDPAWAKILGLPKTATKDQIKKKYRELAKIHHPDKPGGNAKKFAEITSAYEEAIR